MVFVTSCFTTQFTSVTDGIWEDGATWGNASPGINGFDYPDNNDDVVISNGTTVTHSNNETVSLLVIENGGQLNSNATLRVNGRYTNDGTHAGSGQVRLQGGNDTISGTGNIVTTAIFRINNGRTILAGSDLTRNSGNLRCPNNDTLKNFGTLRLENVSLNGNGTSNFFNGTGGRVFLQRNFLNNGTVIASATNNEVHYTRNGAGNQNIKPTLDGYYDLFINGNNIASEKRLQADDTVLNDLTITASTFIAMDTFDLYIKGDLIYSGGAFDVRTNDADLHFVGGAAQKLQGSVELNDVFVNKSAGELQMIGDTSIIYNHLSLRNGSIDANGLLVMRSDASGDSRIGQVGGTLSGNMVVERYIDAGATNWRFITAPITSSTFEQWNDDFLTSGIPGSDYPSFNFASIQKYDESVAGHQDSGFVAPSSMTESMDVGQGYWVWAGDNLAGTSEFTIDVIGEAVTGPVNLPVAFTPTIGGITADGWCLVANPYVSVIDWSSPAWSRTNIDSAVYIFNTDLGEYSSWVDGASTNSGTNLIASSQAFYVKANGASPSLQINEGAKTSASTDFLKRPRSLDPMIKLYIERDGFRDEHVVRLREEATTSFDGALDAYYLSMDHYPVNLFSTTDSTRYAINSVSGEFIDTIHLEMVSPDKYISLHYTKNIQAMPYCMILFDTETNDTIPLPYKEDEIQLENAYLESGRYKLVIWSQNLTAESPCSVVDSDTIVQDSTETIGMAQVTEGGTRYYFDGQTVVLDGELPLGEGFTIYTYDGRIVQQGTILSNRVSVNSSLSTGAYFFVVSNGDRLQFFLN